MSLILVVDTEARAIERIRDALSSQPGFRVSPTEDSARALQLAATTPPDLALVNIEIDGAEVLLSTFARKNGGSGVVALLPERRGHEAQSFARRCEGVLVKPFSEQELRLAVNRGLGHRDTPERPSDSSNRKLTSADIFGDLLAEFQSEAAAPTRPNAERAENEQLRRKLEQTVSGVLGRERKPPAPAAPPTTPSPAPLPPPKRSRTEDEDLDALLSSKLNIDRPRPRPTQVATPRPTASPPAASAEPPPPLAAPTVSSQIVAPAPAAPPSSVASAGMATQRISMSELSGSDPKGPAFGQYILLDKIAVGGMAEVWKARMRGVEGFQKTVAIKKILPHLTDNSAFVTMFIDEAKLAAQLAHPNITHIYDLGKIGNDYYIAMEFIEGRNLRSLLNAARRAGMTFPLGISLLIASRLAAALDYAHRKKGFDGRELGLVHRDVSPQNVLISNEGDIKLCDFGIVKAVSKASHTQMGALKGKLQYMSPEQAWGRQLDGRSDLFALGAILYEMLVGRRLFPGDNEISVLEAVRDCRFDPARRHNPALVSEVDELLTTALAKDPADRFQTAAGMQQALEGLLYAQKPTPTQADLASFVHLLTSAPPASEDAEPSSRVATGTGQSAAIQEFSWEGLAVDDEIAAAEIELPAMDLKGLDLPEEMLASPPSIQPMAAEATTAPPPRPAVTVTTPPPGVFSKPSPPPRQGEARSPLAEATTLPPPGDGPLELEEGGRQGRSWLIAAILALAAIAVVGWLVMGRKSPPTTEAEPPLKATAPLVSEEQPPLGADARSPAEPGAESLSPPTSEPLQDTAKGESEPLKLTAEEKADLSKLLDQKVAKQESELKRKLEADQRRLEQQVLEARAAEDAQRLAEAQAAEEQRVEEERRAVEAQKARDAEAARQREAESRAQPVQQEPPKPSVELGELVRMGPGVIAPKLVSTVKPKYPAAALRLRVEGTVETEVLVDENGLVRDARISRPVRQDVGINEAALAAVRAARFTPATKEGVRVKIWTKIIIPFKLADEKGP